MDSSDLRRLPIPLLPPTCRATTRSSLHLVRTLSVVTGAGGKDVDFGVVGVVGVVGVDGLEGVLGGSDFLL